MTQFLKDRISSISSDLYEEILKPNKSHTNRIIQIVPCNTPLILIQTFLKVYTHHAIIYSIPMYAHNKICGFMRSYIPCFIGSEEKVFLTKNIPKILLNRRNTYLFKMIFIISFISFFSTTVCQVLSHIVNEVDLSEKLYIQPLIYRWQSNPEPREKLVNKE